MPEYQKINAWRWIPYLHSVHLNPGNESPAIGSLQKGIDTLEDTLIIVHIKSVLSLWHKDKFKPIYPNSSYLISGKNILLDLKKAT